MWHNAVSECLSSQLPRWRPGDIVGCYIHINQQIIKFSLNGRYLQPFSQVFQNAK